MLNRLRTTSILLVLANLVPLAGVFLLDWDVFHILVLFWLENAFIGFFGIIKVALAGRSLFRPVFFLLHYGGFMAGHGMLILSLYGRRSEGPVTSDATLHAALELLHDVSWLAAGALFASHAWSFFANYLGNNERERLPANRAMTLPYRRIVITQVALILGAFAVEELGQPVLGLAILVVLKIAFDLRFHRMEHTGLMADVKA